MSTVAERVGAKSVQLSSKCFGRGYDFTPSTITEEAEKDFIFRALFPIGLDAFVQEPSEEMEKDVRDHLFSADHLLVMRSDGTFRFGSMKAGEPRPIAFRMWKDFQLSCGKALYLAGMCVLPSWQGKGIGQAMTRYSLESGDYDYIFTVTQNPVAKMSMDKAIGKRSTPDYSGPFDGTEFAKALGKEHLYDMKTQIIKRNYGGSLYGVLPQSHSAYYNSLFNQLNREDGDAYLCIARL